MRGTLPFSTKICIDSSKTTKIKVRSNKGKRFTTYDLQNIRRLAEMLGKIIPYSGRGNFTLQNIAKEFGLTKSFPKKHQNKKETFSYFIRDVHKRHPRIMKKVFREILPIAIERRHNQGNPILFEEADMLSV